MDVPLTYDMSRLLLRSFGSGPNGIDRVDLCLARHFLSDECNRGLLLTRPNPYVLDARCGAAALQVVEAAWRENLDVASDRTFQLLRQRLLDPPRDASAELRPHIAAPPTSKLGIASRLVLVLLPQLIRPRKIPKESMFLHATQFPEPAVFRWLDRRRDVKPVFFIHDMLPLQATKFFTAEQVEEHRQFLENFVRYGRAAIVNTQPVKEDIAGFLKTRSIASRPILVAPMPASAIFAQALPPDDELRAQPYLVVCGTIEPRKNHALLLKVWQQLVNSEGARAPRLVVIGRRGWNNQEVFDLLDRAPWVRSHIVEVAGLSTPAMKHIVANARALLMPSFAEGYGFPIVEALAAGTPVIASDIPVFRETRGERLTYCAPNDVRQWLEAVRTCASSKLRPTQVMTTEADNQAAWADYFRTVESFLASL